MLQKYEIFCNISYLCTEKLITKMKKVFTTFILFLAVMTVAAQMQDPVHVRSELKKISDSEDLFRPRSMPTRWKARRPSEA